MTGQAGVATFRVLDPAQPRKVVDPGVGRIANNVAHAASSRTPVITGRLRGGWRVEHQGPAHYAVINDVPYARFVEHGTRNMPAEPMLAPVLLSARAG